jgi:hypothetical protein
MENTSSTRWATIAAFSPSYFLHTGFLGQVNKRIFVYWTVYFVQALISAAQIMSETTVLYNTPFGANEC